MPAQSCAVASSSYQPRIELSGLPEHVQTGMARAAAALWEAAMREATRLLQNEREQISAMAEVQRELRDEALVAADIATAEAENARTEIARLKNELMEARSEAKALLGKLIELRLVPNPQDEEQSNKERAHNAWSSVIFRVHRLLRDEPVGSQGLTADEILQRLPAEVLDQALVQHVRVDSDGLASRMAECAFKGWHFKRSFGDRYVALR